jgi:Ca-activated chloride channel family protein
MTKPSLEILPLLPAVSSQNPTTLDVMLRITPPDLPDNLERPLLNLALVIDRSGSMSGNKLEFAKQAATYAVQNLLSKDRISIVAYDSTVTTIVPSTLALDKPSIIQCIQQVRTGGTTALHAGWVEGAAQASHHLSADRLNRVILLSDGLANVGEQNPDVIASDVAGLKQHGVSTTTIGVGRDFNEDLMHAMAISGEGNYYFIESSSQLPDIFEAELHGLMATRGTAVKLSLQSSGGTSITEIYNDFKTDEHGHVLLPDLVAGVPILLAAKIRVPPMHHHALIGELCLSWLDADTKAREEVTHRFELPPVPDHEFQHLPQHPEVTGYLAEMRATRAKEEAIRHLDRGDRAGMDRHLSEAKRIMAAAPPSARVQQELLELEQLDEALMMKDDVIARKRMTDQVYRKKFSRGSSNPIRGDRVEIVMGDLTEVALDAIVNPTNTRLFGTSGVDGAVHRKGGPDLTRACREIGQCKPGGAVFTEGYNLPAKFVIHTASPKWQDGNKDEARLLASCYRNSLNLAKSLGVTSIAFPAIGTGVNGFPPRKAAAISMAEIRAFLEKEASIRLVRIVLFDQANFDAYLQERGAYQWI